MKRFFALTLCLLMAVSVLALPLTASASTAEEEVFNPAETMWYSVEYDASNAYIYTWTPEADGVLTLEAEKRQKTDVMVAVRNTSNSSDRGVTLRYYPAGGYNTDEKVTYFVTGGSTYQIAVMTCSKKAGTVEFGAYFQTQSASGLLGAGTYSDPYKLESTSATLPTIASGKTVYFSVEVDDTKKYDLSVESSANQTFELYIENNMAKVVSSNGSASVNTITPFATREVIVFSVTNTGTGEGGPYTVEITEATATGNIGTFEEPDELVFDVPVTINITNICYYYLYNATENGTICITMPEEEGWICSVMGGESDALYCKSTDETVTNPMMYAVSEGEEITIWFANIDFAAGSLSYEATLLSEGEQLPSEPSDSSEPSEPSDTSDPADNVTEPSIPEVTDPEMGDVNLDGRVNVKDATEIQKFLADLVTLNELQKSVADFDGSGTLNIKDATAIQKFIAGY